jgi:two-component system sensor histidine kinase DesK
MLVVDQVYGDPLGWELALTTVAMTAFMVGFTGNVRLNVELRRTREELAKVAVAAERERIGRDLHDILGHSLTAIAVKAGLARRLVGRDDAAAAAEIGEVEKLAREALADVRATASGFREVSLDSQLAVARSVLRAAGITANLPATVDEVDPSMRELFGYVVREAVTNVVRHAHATTCTVTVGPGMVEIVNDDLAVGAGAATRLPSAPGSGLTGLAERVRAAGGTLVAGPLAGGGFSLRATVPVPRPVPTGRPSTAGRR